MINRGKKKTNDSVEGNGVIATGELNVHREHKVRSVTVAMDHGSKQLVVQSFDGPIAETGAVIERTVQPQQYESLKIGVTCRLPCSVDSLANGSSFKVAHEMCRKELSEQLARGLEGLESPFGAR